MKKLYALPLAALVLAACSESTAPENIADLSPSYAKPVKPPPGPGPATTSTAFFDFNGSIIAAGGTITTDETGGIFSASNASDLHYTPIGNNGFVGRFNNTTTRLLLAPSAATAKYTVDFDLYVIGSWDGRGKQAQSGTFDANVFQVGYRCPAAPATVIPIFTTTFSNQLTVQQDFPLSYLTGGNKAGTGSVAGSIDALGYRGATDANGDLLSNTPPFRSFGDVTYHLTYTIENVCSGAAPQFVFSSTAPGQQSNWDESWGIDNLRLLQN